MKNKWVKFHNQPTHLISSLLFFSFFRRLWVFKLSLAFFKYCHWCCLSFIGFYDMWWLMVVDDEIFDDYFHFLSFYFQLALFISLYHRLGKMIRNDKMRWNIIYHLTNHLIYHLSFSYSGTNFIHFIIHLQKKQNIFFNLLFLFVFGYCSDYWFEKREWDIWL